MDDKVLDNEIVKAFKTISPYLQDIVDDEISFAISDTEKYLFYKPMESANPGIKPGDPVKEGSSSYNCMKSGKMVKGFLPKHVIGVEMMGTAIPVKDEKGSVIGCVSFGRNLKKYYKISSLAKTLSESLGQISATISQLASGLQNVLSSNETIIDDVNRANEEAKNTDTILQFIKGVADQTNLLGLNAAIEAARAGESGKGFGVVAQEVRKLSVSSSESVNKINSVLRMVRESVEKISKNINGVNAVFRDQAQALQQMNSSLQNLNDVAKELQEISRI